jgi:hypothetical protein
LKLQRTDSTTSTMAHRTLTILCKIARFRQTEIFATIDVEALFQQTSEQYRPAIQVSGA